MEQSKFIKTLRKVIQEEIRSVIKQELTEILQEGLKSTINTITEDTEVTETVQPVVRTTKNSVNFNKTKFANILNETSKLTEHKNASDYKDLMTEDIVMTSANAQGSTNKQPAWPA